MEKEGDILKLILKGKGLGMSEVAEGLDMTRQNLNYHLRKAVLEKEFLTNVKSKYSISHEDIQRKMAEMNGETISVTNEPEPVPFVTPKASELKKDDFNGKSLGDSIGTYKNKTGKEFIELSSGIYMMITPLVNKKAYAGYLTGWGDEEYIEDLPKHSITVAKPHQGDYLSFEIVGDSMDDGSAKAIQAGDIVTGRKIERSHWRSKLHLKKFREFVIVTIKGIIVKEIIEHNVDQNTITVRSYNPDKSAYPDKVINLAEVMQIFNVVQISKHR